MKEIRIQLFDKDMAVLREEKDRLAFHYLPDFILLGIEPSPLHLPIKDKAYFYEARPGQYQYGLPGLLADSLPDQFGNDLFRHYLEQKGTSIQLLTAIERLSYIGNRGMGALSYLPDKFQSMTKGIDLKTMMDISLRTEKEHQKIKLSLDEIMAFEETAKINSSIGGRRAKLLISRKGRTIRSAQAMPEEGYKYEILKILNKKHPDTYDDGKIEYIYYKLATECQINMMPCELIPIDGLMHFTTQRFDKSPVGEKNHIQTLAALENTDFNVTDFSLEHIITQIMKRVIEPNNRNQHEQLFTRNVFNIVVGNCDDHTKNTSLLMDKQGKWSLSPAYDITHNYASKQLTSINNKTFNITAKDIQEAGNNLDIDTPLRILEKIQDVFLKFQSLAKDLDVSKSKIKEVMITANTIKNKLGAKRNAP